jgi:hypothetical protein
MKTASFCRRCSVVRVNTLCRLHKQGVEENDPEARKELEVLVKLATERGYADGVRVLKDGLEASVVRSLCWNISSLLTDHDFTARGIDLGTR